MQSLGRKIVNFLGMSSLGQKTVSESLSVAVASGQTVPISVSGQPIAVVPTYRSGFTALRGSSSNLSVLLDSDGGHGEVSNTMGALHGANSFYTQTAFADNELDSVANIQKFFAASGSVLSGGGDPIIRIPFHVSGFSRYSIYIANELGVTITADLYGVGWKDQYFDEVPAPIDPLMTEVRLTSVSIPDGTYQVIGTQFDPDPVLAANFLAVKITPASVPASGQWILIVALS